MRKDIIEKDNQFVWHPYTALKGAPENIYIESASGVYLYTGDGRKIIDAVSSWWVNIHGHCHPYISKAIAEQAQKLDHLIFAGFTHEPAVKLASRLLEILPGKQEKFFFSDNGSTAVEVGIKMAIQYWYNKGIAKRKIVAIEGAYHGDTFGAMSVGSRGAFTKPFQSHLFDVEFIDFPFKDSEQKTIEDFKRLATQGDVAAFIYEPLVQGAAGMRIYSSDVLGKLMKIAKENNIVCIADEVMTGFGRTGKLFASEYQEEKPDIMCLSKGITGGVLPLGGTTCNGKILEAFDTDEKSKTLFHGHSFTANPITCATANASLDLLLTSECREQIRIIQESHLDFLQSLRKMQSVQDAEVLGTILSITIKTGEDTGYFNSLRDKIYSQFLEQDILMRPLGNVIYILPPFSIQKEELMRIYKACEYVLSKI